MDTFTTLYPFSQEPPDQLRVAFLRLSDGAYNDRRAGRCAWANIEIRGRWEGKWLKSAYFPTRT